MSATVLSVEYKYKCIMDVSLSISLALSRFIFFSRSRSLSLARSLSLSLSRSHSLSPTQIAAQDSMNASQLGSNTGKISVSSCYARYMHTCPICVSNRGTDPTSWLPFNDEHKYDHRSTMSTTHCYYHDFCND